MASVVNNNLTPGGVDFSSQTTLMICQPVRNDLAAVTADAANFGSCTVNLTATDELKGANDALNPLMVISE